MYPEDPTVDRVDVRPTASTSKPTLRTDLSAIGSSPASPPHPMSPDPLEYRQRPPARTVNGMHSGRSSLPRPSTRSASGPPTNRISSNHNPTPSMQQMQGRGSVKNLVARFDQPGAERSGQRSTSATVTPSQFEPGNAYSTSPELAQSSAAAARKYSLKTTGPGQEGAAADLQRDIQHTRHQKSSSRSHSSNPRGRRQMLFGEITDPTSNGKSSHAPTLNIQTMARNNASEDNLSSPKSIHTHNRVHSELPSPRFPPPQLYDDSSFDRQHPHHRSRSDVEGSAPPNVFASSLSNIMDRSAYDRLNERYQNQRTRGVSNASLSVSPSNYTRALNTPSPSVSPSHHQRSGSIGTPPGSGARLSPRRYRNSPSHSHAIPRSKIAGPHPPERDSAAVSSAGHDISAAPLNTGSPLQSATSKAARTSFLEDSTDAIDSAPASNGLHTQASTGKLSKGPLPDPVASRSQDHRTFFERAQDKPPADMLSQLSSAVYQPAAGTHLQVDTRAPVATPAAAAAAAAADAETLTAATEFEEDERFDQRFDPRFSSDLAPKSSVSTSASTGPKSGLSASFAPRNVLSQIIEFRKKKSRSHMPTPTSATATPDLDNDESATIQIFLGDPSPLAGPSHMSFAVAQEGGHERSPAARTPATHMAGSPEAPRSINFRPTSNISVAVDHFIEQYYMSGGVVSPRMVDEFEEHIPTLDPDLEGRPEEERKYILSLALEELGRESSYVLQQSQSPEILPRPQPSFALLDSPTLPETPTLGSHSATSYESPSSWARNVGFRPPARSTASHASGRLESAAPSQLPPKTPDVAVSFEGGHAQTGAQELAAGTTPALPEIKDTGGGLGLSIEGSQISSTAAKARTGRTPPPPLPLNAPPKLPRSMSSPPGGSPRETSFGHQPGHVHTTVQPPPVPNLLTNLASHATASPVSGDPSKPQAQDPEERRLSQRRNVIKELIDTEYSYAADMKIVEDIYMATGKASDAITNEDHRVLFGNIPAIVTFTAKFQDSLKRAATPIYVRSRDKRFEKPKGDGSARQSLSASSTSEQATSFVDPVNNERDRQTSIGKAFWEHITQLEEVYREYMHNHSAANDRYKKLKTNHAVTVWLSECHEYAKDLTDAWDLDSLLVKPTQRMLKYHMLLEQLLKATPTNHPDYSMLSKAQSELRDVAGRINDSKKRAELLESINNPKKRGMTLGISKAFDRRQDKFRQQVGLTEAAEDTEYQQVAEKYGGYYLKLQVVMRDFDQYKQRTRDYMQQFNGLMDVFEEIMDGGGLTSYPELESKWRRAAMTIREMSSIAWVDHEAAVQRHCIEPLLTVIKLNEKTQKWMGKRKKRLPEYAKYKTALSKGEKPDRKCEDSYNQFMAFNETLKDELPKLYKTTETLIGVCLHNFVDIQRLWHSTWKRKMMGVLDLDESRAPKTMERIAQDMLGEFSYIETKMLELGIVNGTYGGVNLLASSSSSTLYNHSTASSSRRGTGNSLPGSLYPSPDVTQNQFSYQSSETTLVPSASQFSGSTSRLRSDSSTNYQPSAYQQQRQRGSTGSGVRNSELNMTKMMQPRLSGDSSTSVQQFYRPSSSSTFYTAAGAQHGNASASPRTGVFSSAMPMPDSPVDGTRPTTPTSGREGSEQVLFLAASLFEFRIKEQKYEAGFPYLQYVPGEIFDVIGVKGELWLAKNQDDNSQLVGWIWEKHFAKVADM